MHKYAFLILFASLTGLPQKPKYQPVSSPLSWRCLHLYRLLKNRRFQEFIDWFEKVTERLNRWWSSRRLTKVDDKSGETNNCTDGEISCDEFEGRFLHTLLLDSLVDKSMIRMRTTVITSAHWLKDCFFESADSMLRLCLSNFSLTSWE